MRRASVVTFMKSLEDLEGWTVFVYGKFERREKYFVSIGRVLSDACRMNHNTKLEVLL